MSKLYCIAMVLHPHHKLEYFRHVKWEADWIKTASDLVHNTYETSYATCEVHESPPSASASEVSENKAAVTQQS
ncbi:hypothetical protein PISMIDRAFT_16866 [Pisolithus microcarpus 441]|uniref:Uncharacterized protein n=1 Tax=Pisolithus microcarpus 441 TaxID=765257 RepID=A0A0C9YM94_9AGAM|nr:hypothetical protein PISMIDRAFT_16866 [Pisolithus microcarpus 441]